MTQEFVEVNLSLQMFFLSWENHTQIYILFCKWCLSMQNTSYIFIFDSRVAINSFANILCNIKPLPCKDNTVDAYKNSKQSAFNIKLSSSCVLLLHYFISLPSMIWPACFKIAKINWIAPYSLSRWNFDRFFKKKCATR